MVYPQALYHRAKASELLGQYNECVNDSLSSYKIHPSQEGFQLAVKTAGEHSKNKVLLSSRDVFTVLPCSTKCRPTCVYTR